MAEPVEAAVAAEQQLLESDRDYFATGAEECSFPGGKLLRMPGLEQVPAGCIAVPDADDAPDDFVSQAARCASAAGAALLRFYTPRIDGARETALLAAGLTPSVELGFVAAARDQLCDRALAGVAKARVRPVRNDSDWDHKRDLAASLEHLPDGKQAAAVAWTELERRKCEAGYMDAFLIELDGRQCGAFGLARSGRLMRVKNLLVHPDHRGRGLGRAAVHFAASLAREEKLEWIGAYALSESDGRALYERCGLKVVGEQIEWSRALAVGEGRGSHTLRQTA